MTEEAVHRFEDFPKPMVLAGEVMTGEQLLAVALYRLISNHYWFRWQELIDMPLSSISVDSLNDFTTLLRRLVEDAKK